MEQKRFLVKGDGAVTDTSTGLTWQQDTAGAMNWDAALKYCASLEVAGGGWRLPTRRELESVLDLDRYDPAIDIIAFPGTMSSYYWSSTALTLYANYVWCVFFGCGVITYKDHKSLGCYVRAVRGQWLFDQFSQLTEQSPGYGRKGGNKYGNNSRQAKRA